MFFLGKMKWKNNVSCVVKQPYTEIAGRVFDVSLAFKLNYTFNKLHTYNNSLGD